MRSSKQMATRDARGPLIGYAMRVTNLPLRIDCFGMPHEVLETLHARGVSFGAIYGHDETGIISTEVFKVAPKMEFSGGPHADSILELLDALEKPDLRRLERTIQHDPSALTAPDDSALVPLLAAVWAGNLEAIRLLLANGGRSGGVSHLGMTPLHWAAALGEAEIALELSRGGAEPTSLSWFFVTPVELAQINHHPQTERAITGHVAQGSRPFSVKLVLSRMAAAG